MSGGVKFQVVVPPGVFGGQMLRVQIPNGALMDLPLPSQTLPGDVLLVDSATGRFSVSRGNQGPSQASLGYNNFNKDAPPGGYSGGNGGFSNSNFQREAGGSNLMVVTIPYGVTGGQVIMVSLPDGRQLPVTVPITATPGSQLKIDATTGNVVDGNASRAPPPPSYGKQDKTEVEDLPVAQFAEENAAPTQQLLTWPSWYTFRALHHQPIPLGLRAGRTDLPPPRSTGRKKALLIGINYPGTRAALKGCVNDVYMMQEFLAGKGFSNTPETMVLLIDSAPDVRFQPTKANILKGLQWLVANVQAGDTLFFHYSGHGAQQTDQSGHERDGMNETILPSDFQQNGMITDDEIWEMVVSKVPAGCRLYALMDCCHCGTGMDLSYNWKHHAQWFQEPNPSFTEGDVILFSGCDDHQTSADAYNKLANAAGGAMTTSFVNMYNRNPRSTVANFIHAVHQDVKRRGFRQVPQLSSSQRWDPQQRVFQFDDGIFANHNPQIGKLVTQRFKPQKPDLGSSPLGPMLLAAGVAVLVAPALLGVGSGLAGGVFDGDGGGLFGGGLFDGFGF